MQVFTGLESPSHLVLLLVAVAFFFGAKRLPEIGRSLGHGMRGFKDALTGQDEPEEPSVEPVAVVAASRDDDQS